MSETVRTRFAPSPTGFMHIGNLRTGASAMLIAHNHPSGSVLPSQKDINMTREAASTLAGIGVDLHDHLVFSGTDYYSFEENGAMAKIKHIQQDLKEGIAFYE